MSNLTKLLIVVVALLIVIAVLLAVLVSGNVRQSASAQATADRRITATANSKIILDCYRTFDPQSSAENSAKFQKCWKDGGFSPDLQLTPMEDSDARR